MPDPKSQETVPLRDDLTPEEVAEFIEELLRKLSADPESQEEAARLSGVHVGQLRVALDAPEPLVSVRRSGAGLTGAEVALVVAFAPLAVHVGKSVWDNFILPKLKSVFGSDVVGNGDDGE